jgi:co-chaperonin GroES (HSP10)
LLSGRVSATTTTKSSLSSEGDRVLFGKWSGTEVKIEEEDLLILKESDVMGILEGHHR